MDKRRQRIKNLMELKGLSYRDLANLTGVSSSSLQRYVVGITGKMPIDCLDLIAKALKVSAVYLAGWTDDPQYTIQPDTLAPAEQAHIKKYRQLPERGKQTVDSLVDTLLVACGEQEQPPNEAKKELENA